MKRILLLETTPPPSFHSDLSSLPHNDDDSPNVNVDFVRIMGATPSSLINQATFDYAPYDNGNRINSNQAYMPTDGRVSHEWLPDFRRPIP